MPHTITEPTFTGYISSTHDALLVFECVRRGIMPKVTRRLRDDERRLIRSGSVFVFDERESGIKRWTDGLLWSPSRILWNFLVYRQIDKKTNKFEEESASKASSSGSKDIAVDPLAQGITFGQRTTNSVPSSAGTSPSTGAYRDPSDTMSLSASRGRSVSSASDSAAGWRASSNSQLDPRYGMSHHSFSMVPSMNTSSAATFSTSVPASMSSSMLVNDRKEADLERALVGSLKSSYPFSKDGLCKKTISIQVEGSTQHLISYYKVNDVRSGRLRTPLSLPEISGLNISPMILQKSNFRNPPDIEVLPDGTLRYRGDGSEASRRSSAGTGSGSDNTSGSEGRGMPTFRSPPGAMSPGTSEFYGAANPLDSRFVSYQPSGSVARAMSRNSRTGSGSTRFEPYPSMSAGSSRDSAPMKMHHSHGFEQDATSNAALWSNIAPGQAPKLPDHYPTPHRYRSWTTLNPRDHNELSLPGQDHHLPISTWHGKVEPTSSSMWTPSGAVVSHVEDSTFSSPPSNEATRSRGASGTWSQHSTLPSISAQPHEVASTSVPGQDGGAGAAMVDARSGSTSTGGATTSASNGSGDRQDLPLLLSPRHNLPYSTYSGRSPFFDSGNIHAQQQQQQPQQSTTLGLGNGAADSSSFSSNPGQYAASASSGGDLQQGNSSLPGKGASNDASDWTQKDVQPWYSNGSSSGMYEPFNAGSSSAETSGLAHSSWPTQPYTNHHADGHVSDHRAATDSSLAGSTSNYRPALGAVLLRTANERYRPTSGDAFSTQ